MTDWYWPRVCVFAAVGIGLLVVLDHFGVLAAIGQAASGLLGITLGVAALLVAFALEKP